LFAGGDSGYVPKIIRYCSADAEETANTIEDVSNLVCSAYNKVRTDEIYRRYVQALGFASIAEFVEKGSTLNDSIVRRVMDQIEKFDLGVELLIYGFDENKAACIFEVLNPGRAVSRRSPGYWAVGSGFHMALSTLNSHNGPSIHSLFGDKEQLVCRMLEAKFAAEFSTGVGKATCVSIHYRDDRRFSWLREEQINALRAIWQARTQAPIPSKERRLIERWLRYNTMTQVSDDGVCHAGRPGGSAGDEEAPPFQTPGETPPRKR
jgi:hypothetical protein